MWLVYLARLLGKENGHPDGLYGRITNSIAVDNIPARGLGGGEWTTLGPSGQMPGAGVPLHVPLT